MVVFESGVRSCWEIGFWVERKRRHRPAGIVGTAVNVIHCSEVLWDICCGLHEQLQETGPMSRSKAPGQVDWRKCWNLQSESSVSSFPQSVATLPRLFGNIPAPSSLTRFP